MLTIPAAVPALDRLCKAFQEGNGVDRGGKLDATVFAELIRAADLLPNELVPVLDIDNGARLETYVIEGQRGTGVIGVNGAAARLVQKGDKVIVLVGRDKGRTGEVIEVRPDEGRALVRGVNMVKRHQKQSAQHEGGIISKEALTSSIRPATTSASRSARSSTRRPRFSAPYSRLARMSSSVTSMTPEFRSAAW